MTIILILVSLFLVIGIVNSVLGSSDEMFSSDGGSGVINDFGLSNYATESDPISGFFNNELIHTSNFLSDDSATFHSSMITYTEY